MSNQKALENVLETIIDKMFEKGAVTEKMYANLLVIKSQLVDQIMGKSEDLNLNLDKDNLLDPKTQKALMGIVAAKAIDNKELCGKFLDSLNPKLDKKDDKLDKNMFLALKLLEVLKKVLTENKDKKMSPKEFADALRKELKLALENCLLDKDTDKKLDTALEKMKDPLEAGLRNIFGGDDPRVIGEIPSVVLGPTIGNLFGFTNQTTPDPKSLAFMVESNTFNSNKSDYLGIEFGMLLNDIADGITNAIESTTSKTPFSTEPKPPGGGAGG